MNSNLFKATLVLLFGLVINNYAKSQSLSIKDLEGFFNDPQREAILKLKGFTQTEKSGTVMDTLKSVFSNKKADETITFINSFRSQYTVTDYMVFTAAKMNELWGQIPKSYTLISKKNDNDWILETYDSNRFTLMFVQYKRAKGYLVRIRYKLLN